MVPSPPGHWIPLGEMALLLSLKRRGPLDAHGHQETGHPPPPMVTVRPCCYCKLRTNPGLAPCMGPMGGEVFPNLSSVIGDKLIFTKQTPTKSGWA